MYKLNLVEIPIWLEFTYCLIKKFINLIKAYIKETLLFFFTYYIENLLNFSIPVSYIFK